jgi:hypothetical protein
MYEFSERDEKPEQITGLLYEPVEYSLYTNVILWWVGIKKRYFINM